MDLAVRHAHCHFAVTDCFAQPIRHVAGGQNELEVTVERFDRRIDPGAFGHRTMPLDAVLALVAAVHRVDDAPGDKFRTGDELQLRNTLPEGKTGKEQPERDRNRHLQAREDVEVRSEQVTQLEERECKPEGAHENTTQAEAPGKVSVKPLPGQPDQKQVRERRRDLFQSVEHEIPLVRV